MSRLARLDVIPTADVWAQMDPQEAMKMWHWPFLAWPDGAPEAMAGADPEGIVRHLLGHHRAHGAAFPAGHMADYLTCARVR